MALLIFNNGAPSKQTAERDQHASQNSSLKQVDLSLPSTPRKQSNAFSAPEDEKNKTQSKLAVAYPKQTLSYINTGKAADSLENRRRLRASHVMTSPVVSAMPHELVLTAKALMHKYNISHIVIANQENNPLGLLTAKELSAVKSPESTFIQSIVDFNTLAVSEDTLVRDIAFTFIKHKASAFSVVNKAHEVVGIISRSDLLSLLVSGPNQKIMA